MEIYSKVLSWYFLYATIYRVVVIMAGLILVYLGYVLFSKSPGVPPRPSMNKGEEFAAKEIRLSLKNGSIQLSKAAPGSIFILFGAFVIGLMIFEASPKLLIETMPVRKKLQEKLAVGSSNKGSLNDFASLKISVRGNKDFKHLMQEAKRNAHSLPVEQALNAYFNTLSSNDLTSHKIALALNEMAIVCQSSELDSAFLLSRLTMALSPDQVAFKDTLATSYLKSGRAETALRIAKQAYQDEPHPQLAKTIAKAYRYLGNVPAAERWERNAQSIKKGTL